MAISTGAAILGAAAIGVGGAIMGGRSQKKAAKRAASAQQYGADRATGAQLKMYHQGREDFAPFLTAGRNALVDMQGFQPQAGEYLQQLIDFDPDFTTELDTTDPIYQWKQERGEESINRAMAARGMSDSRPAVNALVEFNKQLAAAEADKQYGRAQALYDRRRGQATSLYGFKSALDTDRYNRLLNLVNIGTGAAGQVGQQGMQTGQTVAGIQQGLGQNLAQNYMTQGNIQGNMWANIGAAPMDAYNMYQMSRMLRPPLQQASPSGGMYGNVVNQGWYTPRYQ